MTGRKDSSELRHRTAWPWVALTVACAGCSSTDPSPTASDGDEVQATRLVVVTQPDGARSGLPLTLQPRVQIADAGGVAIESDDASVVSAALASGEGSLGGTTSLRVESGHASFFDLAISGPASTYVLVFSTAGLPPVTSNEFELAPGQPSTSTSVVSVEASVVTVGESTVLRLEVLDAWGNAHRVGGLEVSFTVGGGTSAGSVGPTTDHGDGSYSAIFTATVAGTTSMVGATIDGESVESTSAAIRVVAESAGDTTAPIPLTDMGELTYHGNRGRLYPEGDTIPTVHAAARPPTEGGTPFVLLSISMSNGRAEFCDPGAGTVGPQQCASYSFVGQAAADPGLNPNLVIVNAAQGGEAATDWESPSDPPYDVADSEIARFGLGPQHVQVVWLKQANRQPTVSLPSADADARALTRSLGNIVRAARVRFPNLRRVYLSSRIWSCTTGGLNGEPFAYEGGFAVKWLIEAQIRQLADGTVDPDAGDLGLDVAPWLAWGPYLWADDGNVRSDGLTWTPEELAPDCTHPGVPAREKVGAMLLDFFKTSPVASEWFTN